MPLSGNHLRGRWFGDHGQGENGVRRGFLCRGGGRTVEECGGGL
jgi:hypothetical protein